MSETLQLALFTACFGAIVGLAGWMMNLKMSVVRLDTTLSVLINMLGKRAAGILHSPHTPELDALIDKFRRDHITDTEMQEFIDMLLKIEGDMAEPKGDRLLASLVLIAIERMDLTRASLKRFNLGDKESRHRAEPTVTAKPVPPKIP